MNPDPSEPAPFVWPPAGFDTPIDADRPADPETMPPAVRPGVGWLARLEHDLIGVRSVSFARWALAAGWAPDPRGSVCWRCAGDVGPHEVDGSGCTTCRHRRLAWQRAVRLGGYDGGVRAAIMELKFGGWRRTGRELGAVLGERLADELAEIGATPGEAVIVPVPTSWRRRVGRGVDHTLILARAAGRASGVRVVRGLGRRHARPQVGLSATARAANVRGAFRGRARSADRIRGARIVVVLDDVRTTGATMTAACRAVRRLIGNNGEVWSVVVGVAADRRRRGRELPTGLSTEGVSVEKFEKTFDPAV